MWGGGAKVTRCYFAVARDKKALVTADMFRVGVFSSLSFSCQGLYVCSTYTLRLSEYELFIFFPLRFGGMAGYAGLHHRAGAQSWEKALLSRTFLAKFQSGHRTTTGSLINYVFFFFLSG